MKTIIAEKPSVAREIARIVGATKREEGYFEGGGYAVTWAFGHLVQLAMPDGYGIRGFVRDNLPVIPETFTLIPRQEKTEKSYKPDSGVVSHLPLRYLSAVPIRREHRDGYALRIGRNRGRILERIRNDARRLRVRNAYLTVIFERFLFKHRRIERYMGAIFFRVGIRFPIFSPKRIHHFGVCGQADVDGGSAQLFQCDTPLQVDLGRREAVGSIHAPRTSEFIAHFHRFYGSFFQNDLGDRKSVV